MAYAEVAGIPPEMNLYAAPMGLILYAIFGTSRQLVIVVSSAVAVMSASIVGGLAPAGSAEFIAMTAALAILAGIVAILAGLLRLGRIAQFFSESVLMGFVSGLALVIMIKQVPKLFGLEPVEGNFWQRVIELIGELPETHLVTLAVGLSSLVLMIIIERRFKRIPAALIVLIYGIAVVSIFGLAAQGVHIVGEIPSGLVPPKLPDISLEQLALLIPGALAITLVIFSEAIGPDRSFASKHHYDIDENQELIGIGAANFGAGLFQGLPIGASLSNSAASDAAGGKTQAAGIVAALATILVALFLTPLFFNLPEAALAAIVIVAVSGMFKLGEFRRLYQLRKGDFALALITFLCVLTFEEVLAGLLIGVLLSLLALIWRTSEPKLSVLGRIPGTVAYRSTTYHPQAIQDPGLLIMRPDEGVFFANAASLRNAIRRRIAASEIPVRTTIVDLEMTNEYLTEQSTAKWSRLSRDSFAVGALARLNNNGVLLHPGARAMADSFGLLPACHNPFYNTAAQLVECLHVVEDSERLIDRLLATTWRKSRATPIPRAGKGVGAIEVPRGILYHSYSLDKQGIITEADCVIPTSQNHANIQHDLTKLVAESAASGLPDSEIAQLAAMLVRAYDPCISCSVH